MNKPIAASVLALSLSAGTGAQAGTITPGLQDALAAGDVYADVPVIIRFTEGLDIGGLRREFKESLKARYPDPKARRAARKAFKRSLLLKKLKERSIQPRRALRRFLRQNGETRKLRDLWAINGVAGTVPAHLVEPVANLSGVQSVALDATIQGPGPGTAPTAPSNWNLDITGAPALWDLGHTGTGTVVATMDTGADASHPDLAPRWRGGANSWLDPYGQHATPGDLNGHGTQVLGLMVGGAAGGYQIGMAPDAQWIAAKIFDNSNEATLSGIHQGFQWMLDPDGDSATDDAPDVVNNSWVLLGTLDLCEPEFAADIGFLKEAEIAVLFSGGNYGPGAATSLSPANDPMVLSVGAINSGSGVEIGSSRGPGACDGGVYPHLVAPGDNVLTADRMPGFYNVVSGTSFAVAHLSGGLALLRGAFPEASVAELETALVSTAVDLGDPGADNDYGYGLMDLATAYEWLGGQAGGGPGSLQLGASVYQVGENMPSLSVTVTRTGGSDGEVSLNYATADGTATAGQDYQSVSGILTFLDGETSQSFTVTIFDDTHYEGDEDFVISVGNAQGGAALGTPVSAVVTVMEDDSQPPADNDGDGYAADVDCDDNNGSVYPGATEVKHDGVDQDCNGYDLTIDITRARYISSKDRLVIRTTSDFGSAAGLTATIEKQDGSSMTKALTWKASKNRWQKTLNTFVARFGAIPVNVTVQGPEGSEAAAVEQR